MKPSINHQNVQMNKKFSVSDKENINFLNFSKIAINTIAKPQENRCFTIDYIPNSVSFSKLATEGESGPYKFQTETNATSYIVSNMNVGNNPSHFRYKSIANMPYRMPIHEPAFKKLSTKNAKNKDFRNSQQIFTQKQKNPLSFQKNLQPQSYSISLQKKQGDLIDIPEISSPEKDEKNEELRVYSLMKNFKNIEIITKQQLLKKESFLSSFTNSENKSMISFPDEITTSAQKNLLFFKKKFHSTPKLLTNLLKKHKNIISDNKISKFQAKISENKLEKILKCGEKLEEIETNSNNICSQEEKTTMKTKNNYDLSIDDANIKNSVYRFLLQRESLYQLNPHSLQNQEEINPLMRAVLIDWMSEVSMEFSLKKQTFQQAVYYLDKFLEINKSVRKRILQLVGISSLIIASKLEEIQSPNVLEFRKACDDGYTLKEIQTMELKIMSDLKWLLHPPILQTWADIYLAQWDNFIENCNEKKELEFVEGAKIYFRKPDEQSYIHYRDFTQILDVSLLSNETLQYKNRVIVASVLFLLLGTYYKIFSKTEIAGEFTSTSKSLFNYPQYNFFFSEFVENYFGFGLFELLPTIQYFSQFFDLEFLYELPKAEHLFEENNLFEGYYEEFLTYHVHHCKGLEFIKSKFFKRNFEAKF